jgi:hypothetical protein
VWFHDTGQSSLVTVTSKSGTTEGLARFALVLGLKAWHVSLWVVVDVFV